MRISAIIRKRIFAVIFASLSISLLCAVFHPFEPRYQGKRLSQWADILTYQSKEPSANAESQRKEAEDAIRHIGTRALPYAIRWCRATGPAGETEPHDWLEGKKLYGAEVREIFEIRVRRPITDEDLHGRSEEIFRVLGPEGRSEIPTLIKLLASKDAGVAEAALGDLDEIGPDAVAPLTAALTNKSAQVRGMAAALFEFSSPMATSAIPVLVLCLRDPDFMVRRAAAASLGRIGTNSPTLVVPALVDALKREANPMNVLSLVGALGQFGTNAQAAVPVLKSFLESPATERFFRSTPWAVTNALGRIDPEGAK